MTSYLTEPVDDVHRDSLAVAAWLADCFDSLHGDVASSDGRTIALRPLPAPPLHED